MSSPSSSSSSSSWTKEHYFISPVDNIKIQYAAIEHLNKNNHNTIIFFKGWKETYLKYKNMLHKLHIEGFNIYTMDHRSQGLSEDTPGSWNLNGHEDGSGKRICYVNDFEREYVADAYHFIQEIVKPNLATSSSSSSSNADKHNDGGTTSNSICVLSHSMGGPITARLAQLYPNLFDRMVLTAPMLMHKNTSDVGGLLDIELPFWLSIVVGTIITSLGLGRAKADGKDTNAAIPTTEAMTHDEKNIEYWNSLRKKYPQIVLAGCSFGWAHGANKFESVVRRDQHKIKIPTLVIGSDDDSFVYTKAMKDFCTPDDNDLFTFIGPLKGSFHEILAERKEISDPLLSLICKFAKSNTNQKFDTDIDDENIPLPPLLQTTSSNSNNIRWKKGYHSGCWPPRFLPVPLVFRDKNP